MSSNVEFPPAFEQDESYSAAITRRAINVGLQRGNTVGSVAGGVGGVGDLAVSQNGTPNMSVNIAVGEGIVPGTSSSTQSGYYVYNNAISNAAVATAPSVNSRIDIETVLVNDQAYGAGSDGGVIATVTGAVSASPVAPSTPANSLLLADIAVGTSVSSIVTGNITDLRARATSGLAIAYLSGHLLLTSITLPVNTLTTVLETAALAVGTWDILFIGTAALLDSTSDGAANVTVAAGSVTFDGATCAPITGGTSVAVNSQYQVVLSFKAFVSSAAVLAFNMIVTGSTGGFVIGSSTYGNLAMTRQTGYTARKVA